MKTIVRIVVMLGCLKLLGGCTSSAVLNSAVPQESTPSVLLIEQAGIEVQSISLSAEGYMLDFRYRVVDPSRAAPIMDRTAECYVIDQKSGTKMTVPTPPKVGSLRQKTREPVAGKIYYIIFANPGKRVKIEDRVTVVIDDLKIPDMTVR